MPFGRGLKLVSETRVSVNVERIWAGHGSNTQVRIRFNGPIRGRLKNRIKFFDSSGDKTGRVSKVVCIATPYMMSRNKNLSFRDGLWTLDTYAKITPLAGQGMEEHYISYAGMADTRALDSDQSRVLSSFILNGHPENPNGIDIGPIYSRQVVVRKSGTNQTNHEREDALIIATTNIYDISTKAPIADIVSWSYLIQLVTSHSDIVPLFAPTEPAVPPNVITG